MQHSLTTCLYATFRVTCLPSEGGCRVCVRYARSRLKPASGARIPHHPPAGAASPGGRGRVPSDTRERCRRPVLLRSRSLPGERMERTHRTDGQTNRHRGATCF